MLDQAGERADEPTVAAPHGPSAADHAVRRSRDRDSRRVSEAGVHGADRWEAATSRLVDPPAGDLSGWPCDGQSAARRGTVRTLATPRLLGFRVIPTRTRGARTLLMLNRRLYLQAWLVAVVALLVAFLTLEPPGGRRSAPTGRDVHGLGRGRRRERARRRRAASAPPGTPGARSRGDLVRAGVPASWPDESGSRVATQSFVARAGGEPPPLNNVFFTQPASAPTTSAAQHPDRRATRHPGRRVGRGRRARAILVELARTAAKLVYRHPLIFLSVDGTTLGNAGTALVPQQSVERAASRV